MAAAEMAAQLRVGLFPATKRIGRRGQPGSDLERVCQPVIRQRVQVLTILFLRALARSLEQTNLLHREGNWRPGDTFPIDRLARTVNRIDDWVLREQVACG